MTRSRRRAATSTLLLSLLLPFPIRATARESLAGKDLTAVNPPDVTALGRRFRGSRKLAGSIQRVTVTRESAGQLELRIHYRGFQDGKIWVEALDERRRRQLQIHSEPLVLHSSTGEAALLLEVDPNWDWDSLRSAYVNVNVGIPERSAPGVIRTYALDKTWP